MRPESSRMPVTATKFAVCLPETPAETPKGPGRPSHLAYRSSPAEHERTPSGWLPASSRRRPPMSGTPRASRRAGRSGAAPESSSFAVKNALKQLRDAVEGDARGRGLVGGQHCGRGKGVHAVLVVQGIHGGEQARAALVVFERVEKVERVQAVGNKIVEVHPDE